MGLKEVMKMVAIIGAAFLLGVLAYAIDHILSTNGFMLILMNIISLVGLLVFAASTFTTVSSPHHRPESSLKLWIK